MTIMKKLKQFKNMNSVKNDVKLIVEKTLFKAIDRNRYNSIDATALLYGLNLSVQVIPSSNNLCH